MGACRACGRTNPEDHAFCGGCGASLAGEAPRDPSAYTPAHLADRILNRRSALQGERKQVTVLFVDLKGSLALSQQLDPETWHAVLDGFFGRLAESVHRFEGTINQFTGDGIMALFGAPLAHEDHADRACRAALRIRDALRPYADDVRRRHGITLDVRMGLNSGEVVVGRIGDDLRMDYTAQGPTVGLAARMQELAEPGRPCLTAGTAALVEGLVELRELGPVSVKGMDEPVRVYELVGLGPLRTRFEASRARGLSPFLGRGRELELLEEQLEAAAAGRGGVVGLVGEAGVGKSRLVYELARRARARGVEVIEGHGVAHGRTTPLLPVAEMVRRQLAVDDETDPTVARQRIAGQLVLLDEGLAPLLPLVFDFLGLGEPGRTMPIDPSARQRQLFEVVRRFVRAQSERGATLLVMEDLHWLDPATERVLEQMADAVAGTRVLLLASFRPGYRSDWMRSPYYREIALGALSEAHTEQLLHQLLGDDPSLGAVSRAIRRKAAGNPLFLEEVVRSLVADGVLAGEPGRYRAVGDARVEVPGSVQSVLAGRLDRLPEREKSLLETAAVAGERFGRDRLARLLEAPPESLEAPLASLCERALLQHEGHASYAFRHPLIQDVAFRSQLAENRRPLHARMARLLAEEDGADGSEHAALAAFHWEQAGELEAAARAHARAGEGSGSLDPEETVAHWTRARELAARAPDSEASRNLEATACVQLLNFGWRQGLGREEADRLFERARSILDGNPGFEAMLQASYGRNLASTADADAYVDHARAALRLARESGSEDLVRTMESVVAHALRHAGALEESLALMNDALGRARPRPRDDRIGFGRRLGFSLSLWIRALRGDTLVFLGRLDEAEADLDEATREATAWRETDLLVLPRYARATLCWARGDPGDALGPAGEALDIAERQGSPYSIALAGTALGFALLGAGDARRAAATLERALGAAQGRRAGLDFEGRVLAHLAEAHRRLGDVEGARRLADEAVERCARRGTPIFECWAQLARARAWRRDDPAAAGAALDRTLALVASTGARVFEPFVRHELATLATARGDAERAGRERAEARSLWTRMGAHERAVTLDADPA